LPIAAAHLWNSLPSHVTAALSLSPSSAVILTQHFFALQLSNSSLICTVPAQWLVILDTIIAITCIYIQQSVRLWWQYCTSEVPVMENVHSEEAKCQMLLFMWQMDYSI